MDTSIITNIVRGVSDNLTTAATSNLMSSIKTVNSQITSAKSSRSTKSVLGIDSTKTNTATRANSVMGTSVYTSISDMINGSTTDIAGFGVLMDNLYMKNQKYYSIIRDYEIMPILIPQINRVLMFLINECISPDIQTRSAFQVKYTPTNDPDRIQDDISEIKKEMKLDSILRDVYTNRYKLGNEYYLVQDYQKTFEHMLEMMRKKSLIESAVDMSDHEYISSMYSSLSESISSLTCTVPITTANIDESNRGEIEPTISLSEVTLNFSDLNIVIDKSPVIQMIDEAYAEIIKHRSSNYRSDNIFNTDMESLNESIIDNTRFANIVEELRKKKLNRCSIERLDPAKVFKLITGGKIIGYMHITELSDKDSNIVNFAQSLKDQLMKSRATNLAMANASAEAVISKELAKRIINTYDPNIGINRIEDIDLLQDFIKNNEIYRGNKKLTFYYEDEVFDLSRSDGSILTNAVFFTKLYSTLLLNNIVTKVLRGRGRLIHTVRLGVSQETSRYLYNAMYALNNPESNLGNMHGSFEYLLNPYNSATDIVIPVENDDSTKFIETDYIPGQDIDMDDDFLKSLLNSIVSSFGLDSAVLDVTNGEVKFARTLTMESWQICNAIINEQTDLHPNWNRMCNRVYRIMGKPATQEAVDNGFIVNTFHEPRSLMLQMSIDEINNAKSYAENIADMIPEYNEDGAEKKRAEFIYTIVKGKTNLDWNHITNIIDEVSRAVVGNELENEITAKSIEYKTNSKQVQYGDTNNDGVHDDTDGSGDGDMGYDDV